MGVAALGGVALLFIACAALATFGWFKFSAPAKPTLDRGDCPVSGPEGLSVVLVDTSDDLPAATTREVQGILDDLISNLPAYHLLEIRVLDIPQNRSKALFSRCNPGDGTGLSEWTDNPRLARSRWLESFRKPAAEAIRNSLASAKAASSPIMAALQDIAIDRFASERVRTLPKKLTVISDMIEYTRDYGQYPRAGDLGYQRFKQSPAYLKYRTDLHGARVTINYVTRPSVMPDANRHAEFWSTWVKDNKGTLDFIHRLQGT
ncbi:hypothetical protein ACH79_06485 [Bradyrhizobium sp. CCBAU 051011]|uniref:hypothetical protein n=1 Tax=Bradyrhizobium sp. CCBAU 051011 TaxID=858422 RepID=UPI001373C791|nr:hypothetical protein [Bradyrhizobium sp. CCBAU 051011]QHO72326.1 hypothetical protein ACH79_06485 [Bradyrhizobium sp. CCBAU 051011]